MRRAYLVWGVGVVVYVLAVLQRTTFGVSGLAAAQRFHAGPAALSGFVVLQVVVYAAMQIPAGLMLDRFGSRRMVVAGAAVMSAGQALLAVTAALPLAIAGRVLVGMGDACVFISVMRLIPHWFPARRAALISQLTGILGQFGQVLSAVPFLALLRGPGWPAAYGSAAALGGLGAVLAAAVLRDTPPGREFVTTPVPLREIGAQVRAVWAHPGTRLGFFTHMGTMYSLAAFGLMWGMPYLVQTQGFSQAAAGGLLSVSVLAAIVAAPVLGELCGRFPRHRFRLVLGVIGIIAAAWTAVLALDRPAPVWLLVLLAVVMSVGGPGSMIGFDYARTSNPPRSFGTAQGMVNIGGFSATLLLIEGIGLVLDRAGGYTLTAFRLAWLLQYPIWALAIGGVLVSRAQLRRYPAGETNPAPPQPDSDAAGPGVPEPSGVSLPTSRRPPG